MLSPRATLDFWSGSPWAMSCPSSVTTRAKPWLPTRMRSTIRHSSSRFTWPTSHPCLWLSVTGTASTALGNTSLSTENLDIRTPSILMVSDPGTVTVGLPIRLDIVDLPLSSMSVSSLNSGNSRT
jgi:hypothetical protein